MWKKILLLGLISLGLLLPGRVMALYQPWIAEQAARTAYNQKKATYSPVDSQKLDQLETQIKAVNKKRTDELSANVNLQAAILDEYINRHGQSATTDKARYWLTYAEEAVAFQQAKNYVFTLSLESRIKSDVTPSVNEFEGDLETLRKKVINSQEIIQNLVK